MNGREKRILTLLTTVKSQPLLTQRMLARELEVSLATANHLLHSLKAKNLVQFSHANGRTIYGLTSAGVSEKLRLSRLRIDKTLDRYTEIRDSISIRLEKLVKKHGKIVFYGAGDVAQIVYIAVVAGNYELVGVVDDEKDGQRFFGYEIVHPSRLADGRLGDTEFDTLLLAAYTSIGRMKENLRRMNYPSKRVLVLFD